MGGTMHDGTAVRLRVDAPEHAPEVAAFLRRLDYRADLVNGRRIETSPPEGWPDGLGLTALEHFVSAWCRAHPDVEVEIEDQPT